MSVNTRALWRSLVLTALTCVLQAAQPCDVRQGVRRGEGLLQEVGEGPPRRGVRTRAGGDLQCPARPWVVEEDQAGQHRVVGVPAREGRRRSRDGGGALRRVREEHRRAVRGPLAPLQGGLGQARRLRGVPGLPADRTLGQPALRRLQGLHAQVGRQGRYPHASRAAGLRQAALPVDGRGAGPLGPRLQHAVVHLHHRLLRHLLRQGHRARPGEERRAWKAAP